MFAALTAPTRAKIMLESISDHEMALAQLENALGLRIRLLLLEHIVRSLRENENGFHVKMYSKTEFFYQTTWTMCSSHPPLCSASRPIPTEEKIAVYLYGHVLSQKFSGLAFNCLKLSKLHKNLHSTTLLRPGHSSVTCHSATNLTFHRCLWRVCQGHSEY